MSLITLTTDFGEDSAYVAVMKGDILSILRAASLHDLSHQIPAQNIRHASYFLATAIPFFPPGTIHVAVIDPGVGTERSILLAQVKDQLVLAPDNGLLTALLDRHAPTGLWKLTESRFWRSRPSATFHGRDIFAPVAAHLAIDPSPAQFGVPVKQWAKLPDDPCRVEGNCVRGSIQFVDHFGNLISNIPSEKVPSPPKAISLAGQKLAGVQWARTYQEAATGELIALISSDGFLEIARVNGNAARHLGVSPGDAIEATLV